MLLLPIEFNGISQAVVHFQDTLCYNLIFAQIEGKSIIMCKQGAVLIGIRGRNRAFVSNMRSPVKIGLELLRARPG